ncbi:MAG: cyclic nucleotide-binding domain-containing protein [Gammaproteobacteria bacterium]
MTTEERAELIDRTLWLKDFSWLQIVRLAEYVDIYEIGAGETLCSEGSHEPYMGLISKGAVSIRKEDRDGHNKVIARLGPGKTFGEMSLIDGQPRSASVKTESRITLLTLKKENFDRLIEQQPKLAILLILKLSKLMSERLRQTSGRLIDFLEG